MKYIILILLSTLLFASMSNFNDFDQFDQFDKQDKQEFNRLKSKAKSCMNSWDFSCAEDSISKMKRYITLKKDNKIIASLIDDLDTKKREKERYEEAQRQANSGKSVSFDNCHDWSNNGGVTCSVRVDGDYKGTLFYHFDNKGNFYVISVYAHGDVIYNLYNNQVEETNCGSTYASSLSDAINKVLECDFNRHF